MPKTIALQCNNEMLMNMLREQGYNVIDMYQAHRQRTIVDAYLYTSYHPYAFTSYHNLTEPTDITLGDNPEIHQLPTTIMLNITNLQPEQIIQTLKRRLQQKEWLT